MDDQKLVTEKKKSLVFSDEWQTKLLGEVIDSCSSGATPYRGRIDYYKGNVKWITSGELNYNVINDTLEHISDKAVENTNLKIHPVGTFLIAITGLEAAGTRGACGIVGSPAATNQSCMAIYPTSELKTEYLYHYYVFRGNELALQYCQGTKQQSYTAKLVKLLPITFPISIEEQQAIATALSDVDALIESLDRLIAKKRDIKQAAMQELLTGKRRLPGFSEEWEVKKLGDICDISMGRTPSRSNKTFWGAGYKWLSIADLKEKIVIESKEEITQLATVGMQVIHKGTLLMSFKLSIGRLCFAGCDLYTNEAICSFNNLRENAEFMYYLLGRTEFSLYGKQAVKGYTLNKESLRSVDVSLPSVSEQQAIATILSDMDTEITALEKKLDKTKLIKQGMMQELLTGRIRLVEPEVKE
ncbi:restriction endonuclease subunit S [Methanolobus sp. WCC5]|uniref:restriction endonuclease subunit S n=1 Tax=Methanolobus sp. WCC5 TaxID=3125785 RepID=UPI0032507776